MNPTASNTEKAPDDWVSGDEPMTGAQAPYLKTLSEQAGPGSIDVFQQHNADHYTAIARIPVGEGAGSTSIHLKSRTQDSLYMSWPNMLHQGGSELLLFYVND